MEGCPPQGLALQACQGRARTHSQAQPHPPIFHQNHPADFKALTGCAAECAYSVDQFPTPVNTSPLVTQPRNPGPNADCPAPAAGTTPIQATALVSRMGQDLGAELAVRERCLRAAASGPLPW